MSKELEKYNKTITSFKNYIKTIENRQEYLYDNEDFYREEIEQNELFLKMLHGVSSYIDNSIPKEVAEKVFNTKIYNMNYLAETDWTDQQREVDFKLADLLKVIKQELLEGK